MKLSEVGMVQYDKEAQKVWATPDVEGKKSILNAMIDTFKFKEKADRFRNKVAMATSGKVLDKLAADLMLVGHGEKVV